MTNFEYCPLGDKFLCNFSERAGSVRDFPNVGLVECMKCFIVRHAQDLSDQINYVESSMHSWTPGHGELTTEPSEDANRRIEEVKKIVLGTGKTNLIDIGCASGTLVAAFNKFCHAEGIEPEVKARKVAISKGLEIHNSILDAKNKGKSFDIVTLFHVIEHIDEPHKFINDVYELMNEDGILIIETPNSMDALLTVYENEAFQNFTYWSHHPILYSNFALASLLERSSFKILHSRGIQRYSLDNHLYWLAKNKPGGHAIMNFFISDKTKNSYDSDLIDIERNDTLWIICKKIN